jgi:hypothetical protein
VQKNAEFWRVLPPRDDRCAVAGALRGGVLRLDGAMARGLMDVLDHGTS